MIANKKLQYIDWNVGKSVNYLTDNSLNSTSHSCAKHIRQALIAGGISAYGNPLYAKDYHFKNYLINLGFTHLATLNNKKERDEYKPIPGDIAVMEAPFGNAGHICMWNGEQWVSDFKQSSMRPYSALGNNPETVYIYRWVK